MYRLRRFFLVLLTAVSLSGLTVLAVPSAEAGPRASVTLDVSATSAASGEQVELSGEVNAWLPGATVSAQVRQGGWRDLASARLSRDRTFSFTADPALGDNDYRVVLTIRGYVVAVSPTRTVTGLLAADPTVVTTGSPVTVSGRLPTPVARTVELRRRSGEIPLPTLTATSEADGSFAFTFVPVVGEVVGVYAAPVKRRGPDLPAFSSPYLSLTVIGTPPVETPDGSMPSAVVGEPYDAPVPAGRPGYGALRVLSGHLPDGLAFTNFVGSLTGTPTTPGSYVFTIAYRDQDGEKTRTVAIDVTAEPPAASGPLTRVNVGAGAPPRISADGDTVVFSALVDRGSADRSGRESVFAWDRQTRATKELSVPADGSVPNGSSGYAVVSADGRSVAFASQATNLVPGDPDTNNTWDIFVVDLPSGAVDRITSDGLGCDCPMALSADGRFLAYPERIPGTSASQFASDVVLLDRWTGTKTLVSHAYDDPSRGVTGSVLGLSDDGTDLTFSSSSSEVTADDHHAGGDVFQWDAGTGSSVLVTAAVAPDAKFGRTSVASPDGRFVSYQIVTGMLEGTSYVWDRETGDAVAVPDPADATDQQLTDVTALSADGRYAVLDLVTTDGTRVYRWDRETGETVRLDSDELAGQPIASARGGSISADGRFVTLTTFARGNGYSPFATLWDAEG